MHKLIDIIKAKIFQNSVHSHSVTNARSFFVAEEMENWYAPITLGPSTVGAAALDSDRAQDVLKILGRLQPDAYSKYLMAYYERGLQAYGGNWQYADILTVLHAAADLLRPQNYLEIGVRSGRSMAIVASVCRECDIIGLDLWLENYAGMPNVGPTLVREEIKKLDHMGQLELISGDSHKMLKRYFGDKPDVFFDLVTVDGDHSEKGATQDLREVIDRISLGGILVFDDIAHPKHRYLKNVWIRVVEQDKRYETWDFTELGYGVALAVRMNDGR